jgi:hypothetical protein
MLHRVWLPGRRSRIRIFFNPAFFAGAIGVFSFKAGFFLGKLLAIARAFFQLILSFSSGHGGPGRQN